MGRGLIGVGGDKGVSFVEVVVREPAQVAARKSQSGMAFTVRRGGGTSSTRKLELATLEGSLVHVPWADP
jgi:hypothetical protein